MRKPQINLWLLFLRSTQWWSCHHVAPGWTSLCIHTPSHHCDFCFQFWEACCLWVCSSHSEQCPLPSLPPASLQLHSGDEGVLRRWLRVMSSEFTTFTLPFFLSGCYHVEDISLSSLQMLALELRQGTIGPGLNEAAQWTGRPDHFAVWHKELKWFPEIFSFYRSLFRNIFCS